MGCLLVLTPFSWMNGVLSGTGPQCSNFHIKKNRAECASGLSDLHLKAGERKKPSSISSSRALRDEFSAKLLVKSVESSLICDTGRWLEDASEFPVLVQLIVRFALDGLQSFAYRLIDC